MEPRTEQLAALVRGGTLDAELAALVVVLLGAHVPVVVAGSRGSDRDALADALLATLADGISVIELAGAAEEFEWLPEAVELGWRRERRVAPAIGRDGLARANAAATVIVARDLAGVGPGATTGERARLVIRALAVGYGLVATIDELDLERVLDRLHRPPIATDADERSRLGVVLAVAEAAGGSRVVAAHFVRPVARDQHGHVQRLPPAVLATWNVANDSFDHFAWGVAPELAARIDRTPIELEREQARLAASLRRPGDPPRPG
ncbi:MAG TPA: hypothetical protein VKB30_06605 [Candidatus Limnocylindrales bacterium]|nr:hypothetical protein [Candidatus Limnocylindrales bacterium]